MLKCILRRALEKFFDLICGNKARRVRALSIKSLNLSSSINSKIIFLAL